jgi:hypothetical protein
MPNKRGAGQVFIGLQATAELLRDLDAARGPEDRSRFIRIAIIEKLQRMGFNVPKRLIYPPSRAKVIQIMGDNNSNITQRAAEKPGRKRKANRNENNHSIYNERAARSRGPR